MIIGVPREMKADDLLGGHLSGRSTRVDGSPADVYGMDRIPLATLVA